MIKAILICRDYFPDLAQITYICYQNGIRILKVKKAYTYNSSIKIILIINNDDELKRILNKLYDNIPNRVFIINTKEIKKHGTR